MSIQLVTFGAVSALTVAATIATPFILSGWADDNFLYTKIPEGTGKIIMKGKSFHHALLSFKGYHLNDPTKKYFDPSKPRWEVLPNKPRINYETRPALTRSFGLFWIGIPKMREVYTYDFSWNEYRKRNGGSEELYHRDETTEVYIANDFTYVMVLEDARTKDNLPVRTEFAIIVRITNPHKALFESNDWLVQLESYVLREGRNFVGNFTFDQLRSETDEGKKCHEESFSKPMRELTFCLPEEEKLEEAERKGTKGAFGITVKAANLESIVLSGAAAEENEKLSLAAYTAEREGDTIRIGAAAKADALRMEGDAQAHVTRVTGDAQAHATKVTGKAEVGVLKQRLKTLGENSDVATTVEIADALRSPGDGKVIVVPSDLMGAAASIASGLGTKKKGT